MENREISKYICNACDDTIPCEISCDYSISQLKCIANHDFIPNWEKKTTQKKSQLERVEQEINKRLIKTIKMQNKHVNQLMGEITALDKELHTAVDLIESRNKRIRIQGDHINRISHQKTVLHEKIEAMEECIDSKNGLIDELRKNVNTIDNPPKEDKPEMNCDGCASYEAKQEILNHGLTAYFCTYCSRSNISFAGSHDRYVKKKITFEEWWNIHKEKIKNSPGVALFKSRYLKVWKDAQLNKE